MEVHHHSHHPKKWKEYITEFLMLFLAVTLGFLAENIREHQVVVERKNQNLEAMVLDLKKDSATLEDLTRLYTTGLKNLEDMKYASLLHQNGKISKNEYVDFIIQKFDSIINDSEISNEIEESIYDWAHKELTKRGEVTDSSLEMFKKLYMNKAIQIYFNI